MDTSLFQKATNLLDDLGNSIDDKINNMMIDIDGNIPSDSESFSIRLLAPNEQMRFLRPKGGTTVGELQQIIETKTGIPIARQRLVTGGKILSDPSRTLRSLAITPATTIHLFPRPISTSSNQVAATAAAAAESSVTSNSPPTSVVSSVNAQGRETTDSPSTPRIVEGGGGGVNDGLKKYTMLLEIGVSRGTVIEKMKVDGVDTNLLPPDQCDSFQTCEKDKTESSKIDEAVEPFASSDNESEMSSVLLNVGGNGVSNAAVAASTDTGAEDRNIDPVSPSLSQPLPDVDALPKVSPPLPPSPMAKYELMVSIGISYPVVKLKMESEGMSASTVDKFLKEYYEQSTKGGETLLSDLVEPVQADKEEEEEEERPCMEEDLHEMMQAKRMQSLEADLKHLDALITHSHDTQPADSALEEEGVKEEQVKDENKFELEPGVRRRDQCLTAEDPRAQSIEVDEWGRLPGPPQLMIMNSFTCPVCLAEGKLEVSFSGQEALLRHYDATHKLEENKSSSEASGEDCETKATLNEGTSENSMNWLTLFEGLTTIPPDASTKGGGKYRFSSSTNESSEQAGNQSATTPLDVIVDQMVGDKSTPAAGEETPMDWVMSALGIPINTTLPRVTSS